MDFCFGSYDYKVFVSVLFVLPSVFLVLFVGGDLFTFGRNFTLISHVVPIQSYLVFLLVV